MSAIIYNCGHTSQVTLSRAQTYIHSYVVFWNIWKERITKNCMCRVIYYFFICVYVKSAFRQWDLFASNNRSDQISVCCWFSLFVYVPNVLKILQIVQMIFEIRANSENEFEIGANCTNETSFVSQLMLP